MTVRSLAVLLISVGLLGCGSEDATDYGDWTMLDEPLSLTEDLRVSETEDFFFGSATDVDVTSEGNIAVADWQANNIKVLRPDGLLIDTLGGSGEGPGEFQRLRSLHVARGDTLYAYDARQSRLTVFSPTSPYRVSRLISVSREEGYVSQLFVSEGPLVGRYGSGFSPQNDDVHRPAPSTVRIVAEDGSPGDSLFQAKRGKRVISEVEGGFQIRSIPFRRTTQVDNGPNSRLYHGWTDSLHIQAHTTEGAAEVVASIPTDPVPITEADRDSVLSEIDDETRSIVSSALPDTKPAFTDLLVGEEGHLWVERPVETPDAEMTTWWMLDPETKTIQVVELPRAVDLEVVRDGQAYGTTTTEMGAPAVVRYRIES